MSFLTGLATIVGLVPSSLVDKLAYQEPLDRAIKATEQDFPMIRYDLNKSLRAWVSDERVIGLLRRVKAGEAELHFEESLLNIFVEKASVSLDRDAARRFLEAFFLHFEQEIFKEDTGIWLLHRLNTQQHESTRNEVRLQGEATRGDVAANREILESVRRMLAEATGSQGMLQHQPPGRDSEWKQRIDEIRDLQREGQSETAIDLYQRILDDPRFQETASEHDRFRITLNVGSANLSLGHLDEAQRYVEEARKHQPDNLLGKAVLAQVRLLKGDPDTAEALADEVLSEDREQLSAWVAKVQAAATELDLDEVPPIVLESADFWAALAAAAFFRDERSLVIERLKRAIELGADAERFVQAAEMIQALSISTTSASEAVVLDEMTLEWAGAALGLLRERQRPGLVARALLVRGAVALKSDPSSALHDLQQAIRTDPRSDRARYLLARALVATGEPQAALYVLREMSSGELIARTKALRARIYLETDSPGEAVEAEIREAWAAGIDTDEEQELLLDLGDTASRAGLSRLASELADRITPEDPTQAAFVHVILARVAARSGDLDSAVEEYGKAAEIADERREEISLELASLLYNEGKFDRAAPIFDEHVDIGSAVSVRRQYAAVLVQLGRWGRIETLLSHAEGEARPLLGWELDLAAMLALEKDDLPAAIEHLEELSKRGEGGVEAGIRIAYAFTRMGKTDEAKVALQELSERHELEAGDLTRLAQLFFQIGDYDAALQSAYQAVRRAPQDSQAAAVLAGTFFQTPDDLATKNSPGEVGAGAAVTLKAVGGEEVLEYLLTLEDVQTQPDELPLSTSGGQILEGKRTGDEVILRPGEIDPITYRIQEIRSGVTYAALKSAERVRTLAAPDAPVLQSVRVGSPDSVRFFAPVISVLYSSEERSKQAFEMYKSKRLPLGAIVSAQGENLRRAYRRVVAEPNIPLWVESGTASSQNDAVQTAKAGRPIVVATTSLLTLQHLGYLELLPELYPELFMPPTAIDELRHELRDIEREIARGGGQRMGAGPQGIAIHEISVEVLEEEQRQIEELLGFIERHCTLGSRPTESISQDYGMVRQALGEPSFDTLMLSSSDRPLLADDAGLRMLAAGDRNAPTFSTHSVLEAAEAKSLLSREERWHCTTKLVNSHHAHVPINAEYLFFALRDEGYSLGSSFREAVLVLGRPDTNTAGAVLVATGLIRQVALAPIGRGSLWGVSTFVLNTFMRADASGGAVDRLINHVDATLRFHPLALKEFRDAAADVLIRGA